MNRELISTLTLMAAILTLCLQAWLGYLWLPYLIPNRFSLLDMTEWCVAAEESNPGFECPKPLHVPRPETWR